MSIGRLRRLEYVHTDVGCADDRITIGRIATTLCNSTFVHFSADLDFVRLGAARPVNLHTTLNLTTLYVELPAWSYGVIEMLEKLLDKIQSEC